LAKSVTIHYNLHRFGPDEFAVGHLINGDFPENDEERWKIVAAPRYRIQRLLDEHLRAQAVLRKYWESGKPFILFLRSFSSERQTHREDQAVIAHVSAHSFNFQQWLNFRAAKESVPIVKLHGGSDSLLSSDEGDNALVLSTHSANWKAVAKELIHAAPAIVFLVSHVTAGVADEFDLIRQSGRMDRCLVVLLDPSSTPAGDVGDAMQVRSRLADFPNVFEFRPGERGTPTSYPEQLGPVLMRLLKEQKSPATLEQALNAEFTYLEAGYTDSKDFAETETFIWQQMRLLRVMFEDSYWAALKSHGIPFEHFTFSGAWKVAHQLYGLAVAVADFRAIRESLRYLGLLYVFRGADFALVIPRLAAQYRELAAQIFRAGEPETEARYAVGPDPLELPTTIDVALELFELAETTGQRKDSETAIYLYHAAVICALRSTDREDSERRWIIANMCRDWAKFQGGMNQLEWAVTNCAFAVRLFRDLAAADPDQYTRDLALSLNNLGSLFFRQRTFSAADAAFVEALKIRRAQPPGAKNYLVDLYTSFANLGLLRVELGGLDSARALYGEALAVCEKRLDSEPTAIVDMTRVLCWMSLCLAKGPETAHKGLVYAQRAERSLAIAARVSPESEPGLRELVNAAIRAANRTS
jgi:tetratricopeptide (TPR) repeat protein